MAWHDTDRKTLENAITRTDTERDGREMTRTGPERLEMTFA